MSDYRNDRRQQNDRSRGSRGGPPPRDSRDHHYRRDRDEGRPPHRHSRNRSRSPQDRGKEEGRYSNRRRSRSPPPPPSSSSTSRSYRDGGATRAAVGDYRSRARPREGENHRAGGPTPPPPSRRDENTRGAGSSRLSKPRHARRSESPPSDSLLNTAQPLPTRSRHHHHQQDHKKATTQMSFAVPTSSSYGQQHSRHPLEDGDEEYHADRRRRVDSADRGAFPTSDREEGDEDWEEGEMNVDDEQGDNDDDMAAMQAMMGFGGFGTTKGKKIVGNNVGGIRKEKKSEYRQYMNRQGGFNRPLSPSR